MNEWHRNTRSTRTQGERIELCVCLFHSLHFTLLSTVCPFDQCNGTVALFTKTSTVTALIPVTQSTDKGRRTKYILNLSTSFGFTKPAFTRCLRLTVQIARSVQCPRRDGGGGKEFEQNEQLLLLSATDSPHEVSRPLAKCIGVLLSSPTQCKVCLFFFSSSPLSPGPFRHRSPAIGNR